MNTTTQQLEDAIHELTAYIADQQFTLLNADANNELSVETRDALQLSIREAAQDIYRCRCELSARRANQTNNTEGNTMNTDSTTEHQEIERTETLGDGDGTVSVTEAATLMGVTGQTIRNWVRAGKLTRVQRGKQFRINAVELQNLPAVNRELRVVESNETRVM